MRPFITAFLIFYAALPCVISRAEDAAAPEASVTRIADGTITQLELLHAKAMKLMDAMEPREAVKLYLDILLIEPDDDAAYTNMGQAYLMLGDADRAKDAFLNALHINPDNDIALAGLKSVADPDGTIASGEMHDALEEPLSPQDSKQP